MNNFENNTKALGWVVLVCTIAVTIMYLAYIIIPILIISAIGLLTFYISKSSSNTTSDPDKFEVKW